MSFFYRDIQQVYALVTNCCQTITPIIVMLFLLFLQLIVNHYLIPKIDMIENGDNSDSSGDDEGRRRIEYKFGHKVDEDGIVRFLPCNIAANSMFYSQFNRFSRSIETFNFTDFDNTDLEPDFSIYYNTEFNNTKLGSFLEHFFKEYKIIEMSPEKIDEAYQNRNSYWDSSLGGIQFESSLNDPFDFKYTIQYEKRDRINVGDLEGVVNIGDFNNDGNYCGYFASGVDDAVAISDVAVNTFLYHQANFTVGTFISGLPYKEEMEKKPIQFNLTALLGIYFYPFILLLGFPAILLSLVMEKESQLKEMMLMAGLREHNYLFATFCFKFFWTFMSLLFFFLLGVIYQHRMMLHTEFTIQLMVGLGISFHLVSIAFLFSSFIYSSFIAAMLSYFLIIFIPLVSTLTSFFLKGLQWKWLLFIPLVPVVDVNYRMLTSCLNFVCLESSFAWKNQDFLIAFVMLYSTSIVYLVLSRYIEEVSPKSWGTRKHPLYFLCFICYFLSWCCCTQSNEEEEEVFEEHEPITKIIKSLLFSKLETPPETRNETYDDDEYLDETNDDINNEDELQSPKVREETVDIETENNNVCDDGFGNDENSNEHDLIKKRDRKVERIEDEDEDVYRERFNILNGRKTRNNQVILVKGISKDFGRGLWKLRAVNSVHFGVKNKSCFGLLGPNGAGKTTLIRILSGLYGPSKGNAYIDGRSIRREMSYIRTTLGLCPQFSVCWNTLTAREHLLFYTRLKGVTSLRDERKEVDDILERVGLLEDEMKLNEKLSCFERFLGFLRCCFTGKEEDENLYSFRIKKVLLVTRLLQRIWCFKFMREVLAFVFPYEKKCSQLSGGLRRRLSLGIALTGNPKCILLDETTTGLDPIVRKKVWDVIEGVKKERSVILTTHSMEEAEKCCDDIAIMSRGRLICLGTPLHLKNRHGNGYTLTVKFMSEESSERSLNVIEDREAFGGIYEPKLIRRFGQIMVFEIRKPSNKELRTISFSFIKRSILIKSLQTISSRSTDMFHL